MTMDFPIESAYMQYLKWDTLFEKEKPFHIFREIPPNAKDQRVTNITFEHKDVEFHNIRGHEEAFELDTHGFMIRHQQIQASHFVNKQTIETSYLPEVEKLLKQELDRVDHVYFFDWRVLWECSVRSALQR